jgi:hypothetical protein
MHKAAKRLNIILNNHLHLNNLYNTTNSNCLAHELVRLHINTHHRFLTLDIKDLYVSVPIQETLNLTKAQLTRNNKRSTNQIMTLQNIILKQNYFSFGGQIYQPDKGVATGSPVSGTMAEVFLQHLEESTIKHLTDTKILSFYTRYVDDILLIYDSTHANQDNILQYINTIHSNIQLSLTLESNIGVNFLDLSITRNPTHFSIGTYRKPTTTDTTINFLSNHPLEHKMAAYSFLIRRMLTLPLHREQQFDEWQQIRHTAHNNNIPKKLLTWLKLRTLWSKSQSEPPTPTPLNNHTKWVTFTYPSPQIRKVTNIFRHTNIRIAFKCNNTISQLSKPITKKTSHRAL